MPVPRRCPHPACPNHLTPAPHWAVRCGTYHTAAHGTVQRYRCRGCRHTVSDQTESVHFFAKRRLPLQALWFSVLSGSSLRECARRYSVTPQCIQNAVLRLGRQAMSAHLLLLACLPPRHTLVYDGLRSCVSSQDYPCDLTTVVDHDGEMILTITHTICRRGGTTTPAQRRRCERKHSVWRPKRSAMSADISLLHRELWAYLRPPEGGSIPAVIHTDEQPLYRSLLASDAIARHFCLVGLFEHRRTPGSAPRTVDNPLFAVNYVDRLLRHRVKEHTRESIAIGRHATMQMHRAWMFAYDHNCMREYRVKRPGLGTHAEHAGVPSAVIAKVNQEFFVRRIVAQGVGVPQTIRQVWMAQLPTPPLRWKVGQLGTSVHVPDYAVRDLFSAHQHAA